MRQAWRNRGLLTPLISVVVVALFLVLDMRVERPASATSGGSPYEAPEVIDTNPDPDIIETTIVAQGATVDLGNGVLASMLTFNGQVPGPLFRLKVGDTVIVHFENQAGHPTGIHWHGIELANASDGTPLTQDQVPPGEKFLYKFIVPRPGLYWYHPHHHSSTNQVWKGLYGAIVVTDPNEAPLIAAGRIPDAAHTLNLALSDVTVCKAVGSNDTAIFDLSLPWSWVGGGPLPAIPSGGGVTPLKYCQGAADGGSAIDEDGVARGSYSAGEVPNIQLPGTSGNVPEGQLVLTNGKQVGMRAGSPQVPGALDSWAQQYEVAAGQGLRMQISNLAVTRFMRLRLTDNSGTQIPLFRIGGQGGILDAARLEGDVTPLPPATIAFRYDQGEILLNPGDRADVVAAIPASATGTLTMWTEDFKRHGNFGFSSLPTVPVAHFLVVGSEAPFTIADGTGLRSFTGSPVEVLGAPSATLLNPAGFSPVKDGMSSQDIRLTNKSNKLGVNEVLGSHDIDYPSLDHENSARYAKLGDTLELTVTNATGADHPFHLHGFSIQPISLTDTMAGAPPDGGPDNNPGTAPTYVFPYKEFRDNIDVPGGYTLKFRVKLDDRPLVDGTTLGGGLGRWVFHCHIFFHATFGMISEFVVGAADGKERPYVNANGVEVEGNVGDSLTMHGTFVDTDGEAVTLSANVGTVTDDGGGAWTWTYTATAGDPPFVYITATDAGGRKDQALFALNVNRPPVVTVSDASGAEGSVIPIHATAVDPDGDTVTSTWSYVPFAGVDAGATCAIAAVGALDTTITCTDDGIYKITLTASDGVNAPVSATGTLTVSNVAPSLTMTSPPTGSVYIVGTTVPVSGSVSDPGSNDVVTCNFVWDGGGPNSSAVAAGGVCTKSNTFTAAGVYTLSITATDDDGGSSPPQSLVIVIYDPNAGFVTAGGTINSPPGAYVPAPPATGKANFGVVSKYQKGDTVPKGQSEFNFKAAALNFHASSYQWLVVTGFKAQYKGTGTINGAGAFGFLLTVNDGQQPGGGGVDKLRLKIWDTATNTVIYDNASGSPDDIDVANPPPIDSGSVVIHK